MRLCSTIEIASTLPVLLPSVRYFFSFSFSPFPSLSSNSPFFYFLFLFFPVEKTTKISFPLPQHLKELSVIFRLSFWYGPSAL